MESFHEERQHAFSNLQPDLFNSPLSLYWYHFDVMVVDIPPYCHKKSYQNLKFDLGLDVGFDVDVGMGLNVDVELDVGLARQILKPQY